MGSNYKSRLVLTMSAAVQLCEQLGEMIKFSETLPEGAEATAENGALKSEVLAFDSRRYYLDLKENQRGRFLRIAQTVANPRMSRAQIAIPAQGMIEMRDTLHEMLEKYSEGFLNDGNSTVKQPAGYRTSITIPQSALDKFRHLLDDVIEDLAAPAAKAQDLKKTAHLGLAGLPSSLKKVVGGVIEVCACVKKKKNRSDVGRKC
ncbi:PurA ssDNA and RNA-binding protein [Cooperia oncophora]